MPQIFDVIANENARYKRNELEYLSSVSTLWKAIYMRLSMDYTYVSKHK